MLSPTQLTLIPFSRFTKNPELLPAHSGVYMIFLKGGRKILQTCCYYESATSIPLRKWGRDHVYTGSSIDLRFRLLVHSTSNVRNSNFRQTLLSLEQTCRAISRSNTPYCSVKGEETLTRWLSANASVAVEETNAWDQVKREKELLMMCASPFNIAYRRSDDFAKKLSEWRQQKLSIKARSSRQAIRYQ
jgi:hypothetical protein